MSEPSPRMRRILDAAVAVLSTEGLRGLTHRAVDERAGLPQGSCSAYLRTRQALLEAVADHLGQRLTDDVARLTARLAERPGDAEHAARETGALFLRWLKDDAAVTARLELTLESTRRPALASAFAPWRDRLDDAVCHVVAEGGHARTVAHARTVTASLDGILMRALVLPRRARASYLEESLALLFRALSQVPD